MPERKRLLISGVEVEGEQGGPPLVSVNPATGEVNHEVDAAGSATVDAATRDADRAARQSEWRDMLPMQRARILYGIADPRVSIE